MTEYLDEDLLIKIALHNGCFAFNYQSMIKNKTKYFNDNLIKDLLSKQPELQSIYDNFSDKIETEKFINVAFGEAFDGKIKISNFLSQIFGVSYRFNGDPSQRTKLFKEIFEQFPPFLIDIHHYIKNNNISNDFQIFDSYFQFLKTKNAIKHDLSQNEIITNIDNFITFNDVQSCKKKINAYLSILPKDEKTYTHIMNNMGELINKTAMVKLFWEDKLKLFNKIVNNLYYSEKIEITPFNEQLSYNYKFSIDTQYIIHQTGVSTKKAEDFKLVFYNSLGTFLLKYFPDSEKANNTQANGINFNFIKLEHREKAQEFCHTIGQDLNSLFKNIINNTDYFSKAETLTNYFDKLYLAQSLNQELNINNLTKKNKNKL